MKTEDTTQTAVREIAPRTMLRTPFLFVTAVLEVLIMTSPVFAQLRVGDILVADFDAGATLGQLFLVDPQSGLRTVFTDFGASPGIGGIDPRWIALERTGGILIVDQTAGTDDLGALIRVSPATGVPQILSDFGSLSQGPLGAQPVGVAVETDGRIVVMDIGGQGTTRPPRLFRVNPATGDREVLSDFSVGTNTGNGFAVAVEADGHILVLDQTLQRLLRVDPSTGARTVVSNLTVGPTPLAAPRGIAVEASGGILVIDIAAGTSQRGLLARVDPQTGSRVPVSDFGDIATGALAENPQGVAVEPNGNILVTDQFVGTLGNGALYRVDPTNGNRILLSDFGNSGQGPLGANPFGVATVPPPPGRLIVIDDVVNDNGGTGVAADWTVALTGVNPSKASFPAESAPGTTIIVDAGSYTVDVSGPPGYIVTLSSECAGTIASGETRTCTITTNDQAGTLLVATEVINDNGSTRVAADWTTTVTGIHPSPASFPGVPLPGTTVTLDPGAYSVGSTGPAGYTTVLSLDCSGSVAAGQTRTCTITHDDLPFTLTVISAVINNNGGTRVVGDWTITVTGNNPSPASFAGTASPGTVVTLNPGAYSVTQTGPTGYANTLSLECTGSAVAGAARTCTITNDDLPPAVPMCNGKVATIVGGPGNTELRGTTGDDVIVDLEGDNIVRGRGGNDTVCTGPGNDQVILGGGNDLVIDTGGRNTIDGGAGADTITTADGDDVIDAGAGSDVCTPGPGVNVVKKCEVVR